METITTVLTVIVQLSGLVFVVASMLSMGLSLTINQIITPLKNGKLVIMALIANFIIVPLVALALVKITPMLFGAFSEDATIAFILLATAAGAPFLPKLAQMAQGNIAFSVGLGTGQRNISAALVVAAGNFSDRQWYWGFVGGSHEWLRDEGRGGIHLDARITFFYGAIAVIPAMVLKMIGKGSQYAFCSRDKDGQYLDGGKTYKLTIPPNVPAKDFWSIVLYDPQTRAMLQTDQRYPALNSVRSGLKVNDDGSVDLYFGPEPPEGKEANWIQTVPGKGWFAVLRIYGPLEPWFDRTWQPGDFESLD